jgi:hypothetical protein
VDFKRFDSGELLLPAIVQCGCCHPVRVGGSTPSARGILQEALSWG